MSLDIGQKIELDVFGLKIPGVGACDGEAVGTVIALGPGVITVQLEGDGTERSEITVSPGRVFSSRR